MEDGVRAIQKITFDGRVLWGWSRRPRTRCHLERSCPRPLAPSMHRATLPEGNRQRPRHGVESPVVVSGLRKYFLHRRLRGVVGLGTAPEHLFAIVVDQRP